MKQMLRKCSFVMALSLSATGYGQSFPQPTYEGLHASKQICLGMAQRVHSMISLSSGNPEELPPVPDWGRMSPWMGPQGTAMEAPLPEEEILENDTAASFALSGMSKATFALGQSLDEAIAFYGTPSFGQAIAKVCGATQVLTAANQGAKIAAALPFPRLYKPQDFEPFDWELAEVRAQTQCF